MKLSKFYVVDAVPIQFWTGNHLGIIFNFILSLHWGR